MKFILKYYGIDNFSIITIIVTMFIYIFSVGIAMLYLLYCIGIIINFYGKH